MSGGTCYVCGSPELVDDSDPRNPLCGEHLPARLHKVSMQTETGGFKAVCSCGWECFALKSWRPELDEAVETHWREASKVAA